MLRLAKTHETLGIVGDQFGGPTYAGDIAAALVLIAKGDSHYRQKDYKKANEQYKEAVNHLSASDKSIQKKLGETYKKLAQSYKRLKDRVQTAHYYKKALDVFTALKDKKNMARTLNTLAEAERYLDHFLVALDYSIRGLEIHKQIDDEEGYAKASMGAGIIYRYIGRYEKSLEHIYDAQLYYKKVNNINRDILLALVPRKGVETLQHMHLNSLNDVF